MSSPNDSDNVSEYDEQGQHPSPYGSLATVPTLGHYIPQTVYVPLTSIDRRRYVDGVILDPPINFLLRNPDQEGIPLRDAINVRFGRLVGKDDLMFLNRGPSISIRLQWPGYQAWSRQIPTRDFRSPPGPITRSKLAKNVARSVMRFIDEYQTLHVSAQYIRWKVGPGYITVDDLILTRLLHVSMGSWQAEIRLARP